MKDYSQHGEFPVILEIFEKINKNAGFAVEFGAANGVWYSNIRNFIELGWNSLQMDGNPEREGKSDIVTDVKKEFITSENINYLFKKYNVPNEFELLSIDIDGNDYWIWKNLNYFPDVVIIEYNSNIPHDVSVSLKYDANYQFDWKNGFYSASLQAYLNLAKEKNYFLYLEMAHTNLIFIHERWRTFFEEYDISKIKLPVFPPQHGGYVESKFEKV